MEKIYSKVKPEILLHMVNRLDEVTDRTNVIPGEEFTNLKDGIRKTIAWFLENNKR